MKHLIIYDNEGFILSMMAERPSLREPIGVPFLWAEIPQGKQIQFTDGIGVNVSTTPHELILEDAPASETQLLEAKIAEQQLAMAELAAINEQDKLEMQLAMAELASIMTGGDM